MPFAVYLGTWPVAVTIAVNVLPGTRRMSASSNAMYAPITFHAVGSHADGHTS